MNKKIITLLKMILLSLGLIAVVIAVDRKSGLKVASGDAAGTTSHYFAMGTSVSVNVYGLEQSNTGTVDENAFKEQIVAEIKALDHKLLSWRSTESELGGLNSSIAQGTEQSIEISTELYVVLKQSLDICRASEGALDITIRPLAMLWNIEGDKDLSSDTTFMPPNERDIEEALKHVDYEAITILSESYSNAPVIDDSQGLNSSDKTDNYKADNYEAVNYYVSSSSKDIIIDLGATGKGYALDKAKDILDEENVKGALITVGGSVLVYGKKSDGSSWRVGVRDPLKPNDTSAMIGYLEFDPGTTTCVSTSGGYEKYKTYEGRDYHHILDSKTGYPSDSGLLSVTVVCDNGLVSDGLSTACFVLGYERSLPLLEKYNAQAVFMDNNGDIIVTDGLKACWVEQ